MFEILGLLFDVSRTKANNTFNYWVEILREILPVSQIEQAKKMSENIKNYTKDGVSIN
ncbi:transposase family protein [Trichormus azollae]|uniref:transposase family protein n=1 Tax=Trichormus azollae TaxID=1164 RepID=UPI003D356B89